MKLISIYAAGALAALAALMPAQGIAQERSGSTGVQRRTATDSRSRGQAAAPGVTQRMQNALEASPVSDADIDWMRVLYRELDLTKPQNAPLYYPDEVIDGQKNLFRVMMDLVASGQIPVYEYLDGREIFTDQYKVKVRDMLDRFHIMHTEAKGSTEKKPRFDIDESDVPANEVLSYYIIERWEFDRRTNKLRCVIEGICPVLHRSGDFGGEAVKYPMFWARYDDLKPHLSGSTIFLSDDNNLPSHTVADFFALNLYDGEIYKTRNLRNLSLAQQYSDPDARKRAQDSIQSTLDNWGKKMWVPSLEELEAMRVAREEAEEAALAAEADADLQAAADAATAIGEEPAAETPAKKVNSRVAAKKTTVKKAAPKKKTQVKKAKAPKSTGSAPANATRSVRNRKR